MSIVKKMFLYEINLFPFSLVCTEGYVVCNIFVMSEKFTFYKLLKFNFVDVCFFAYYL